MLPPAQESFCQVFAQNQDACGAYREAFLVPCALHSNTVSREVHHLLDQPCVQNRMDELREEQAGAGDGPGDGAEDGDCSLWRAVIARAIEDARGEGLYGPPKDRCWQQEAALSWLTRPSRDLFLVCELAGLEPDAVMARARSVLVSAAA